MEILFIESQTYPQDEYKNYWFSVDGAIWGLSMCLNGSEILLDCDGNPVEQCNDHERVKPALIKEVKARQKASDFLFSN